MVEGIVTEFSWRSPHVYMVVDLIDEESQESWTFEGHSIPGLLNMGWKKDSVQVGDRIVIVANPSRNPKKRIALLDSVTRLDGKTFYSFRVPEGKSVDKPNRAPIAPSVDFTGTWKRVSTLQQALVGAFSPPSGWPLTEKGQAQIDSFNLNDDPYLNCVSVTVPRIALMPYSHGWVRTENAIIMTREHYPVVRTIYLDSSTPPANYIPNPEGYSVGHFEDDGTLVIETSGFIATPWGNARGLDSSEHKLIVEHYKLTNDGYGMNVAYTITDPVYLTEPVSVSGAYFKVADYQFIDEHCNTDTAQRHLQFE